MCLRTHAFSAHVSAPGLTPCRCAFPVPACGPGRALLLAALRSAPAAFHPRLWRRSRACAAPLPVARAQRLVRLLRLRGTRTFHSLARYGLERRL